VANFIEAARATGLEWLAEDYRVETENDEDSEYDDEDLEGDGTLYVTMPSLDGLRRMLALWNRYSRGEERPSDARAWWSLFGYLKDVRTWSAKDRIDPVTQSYVDRLLREQPDRPVRFELDLWFRENGDLRAQAETYIHALMGTVRGRVLDFATIDQIRYQAALVEMPAAEAAALRELGGPLANADSVMRVRPQSLFDSAERDPVEARIQSRRPPAAPDPRPSIAALLDGYPIQNHELLANRVDIEEVEIHGADVPVARRRHGTAMASLIIHGDLGRNEPPIDRTLKVVPVLAAPQGLHQECTPLDRLPIAMVYRAVTALVAGLDGEDPLGERVVIINHSICDQQAPFARRPSPWAKLLDYMSHEYNLLFVVSAGNTRESFTIDTYLDCDDFSTADPDERQIVLLRAIERAKGTRLILSPAESVNAITVGAVHDDGSGACPNGHVEPFAAVTGVANLSSSVGLGVNRAIKPDIVEAGGRQLAASDEDDGVVSVWAVEHGDVGQLTASADPGGGTITKLGRSTGTSNAAALVTRSAIRIADALETTFAADGEVWGDAPTRASVLKALLVHSASWGDTFRLLDATYPPAEKTRWQRRREAISRFLGYGRSDMFRILTPAGNRITLLADDVIGDGGRHEYEIPIPRAMINNREVRRVVLTLAWSSPVDPASVRYRGLALEMVDRNGRRGFWDGVGSSGQPQPHPFATRRGTVQHLVLEGKKLMRATGGGSFFVGVQARAAIASLTNESAPYGLAITLEMAQPLRQDLFADVAARVRPKTQVRTRVPNRIRTR
jgi:hypothetical protein